MNITVNGQTMDVPEQHSVLDIVRHLGLEGKRIAIECNGEIVPKSLYADTRLTATDQLEVVVAVGGG